MKKNNLYLIIIIFLFLIAYKINLLKSVHDLFMNNYDERISNVYGFCDKEGIGYVNFIKKEFKINGKIKLINSLIISQHTTNKLSFILHYFDLRHYKSLRT